MASQQFFNLWIDFKTKKEISWRPFVGSSALKDEGSKSDSVCFLKHTEQAIVTTSFNISK